MYGFVRNDINGVEIQIQANKEKIEVFKKLLQSDLPPLANIQDIQTNKIKINNDCQFEIITSNQNSIKNSLLSTATVLPDTAICVECKTDISKNSKYTKYFSTNCTNCGPRYSIIKTVPYDRINTSMKDFILCEDCKIEYENPLNRRYHAQATSCKICGPQLELSVKGLGFSDFDYEKIAKFIKQGKIGAIKGVGGFHIVCDAFNDDVVKQLRVYKNRPTKPFAIMCKDLEQIKSFVNVKSKEEVLLKSKEAPIVILEKNKQDIISTLIAPNISKIGCFLPYTAFYHILFKYFRNPIIATSANLGGGAIITKKEDILSKLPFIDFIVDYNRDIVNGVDDSVVQVVNNDIQIHRLSRGYTPKEIILDKKIDKKILCLGANQKSSIVLAFDNKIILSPYIGDLDNIESFNYLQRTIETFKNFYDFNPDIIVCDKHPNYHTTKLAQQLKSKNQKLEIIQVQHHLAHQYSVMAEYNLKDNYTSFIFDGTGYGDDKTLWGGEIFVNDKRKYYFKYIKLLGGEKAIKEPRRVALSILFDNYDLDKVLQFDLPFTKSEIKILYQSWSKNINAPLSSSVGRLFDAVSSFSNICHYQSYEGEAGLLCEMAYDKKCNESFEFKIIDGLIDIKFDFLHKQIVSRFINTLVKIIVYIAKIENLPVILSGGVFQNKTLLELVINKLEEQNIKYYYNKTTSINDSGIALGQLFNYIKHNLE